MKDSPETEEMPKAYEPGKTEEKWYKFWMEKCYFTPEIDWQKKPFVIIMPPPNLTGSLHVGQALTATLEDIMIRWHRMKGEPTLWLPGADHAAIAAQVVVERELTKEGTDRHKLGREGFLERMHKWMADCRRTQQQQHMKLGASCDWTRERYTMDEKSSRAVRAAFVRLFNKGLIYRGERITNWCPRCATALSDLEVEHKDVNGHLWYVRYPLAGEKGKYITVATTRPETILGDTAVAVNPQDKRFKGMTGQKAVLPAVNREIPIIADEAVSPEFGTGAVKITPAHDPVDFEVAQRHGLPLINILNADVTMNENAGPYQGMDRYECRKVIVADLEKTGLLVKIEPYTHAVGHCDRCHTIVEPIASWQWFVKTGPLAKPAIEVVKDGRIKILPERFTKVYLNWMENIRDWCISRQLWWGHRIPIWYCGRCGELTVTVETPTACAKCGSQDIKQDEDTLDTWFSSGLWPHSTLGWPDDTEDRHYFYPTSVMETAYDIIFFWVARMIMLGIEDTGEIPFHTVYLHGLIRDDIGDKISKSKGNVVDPLELMELYGTDALRFALTTGTSPGNDLRLSIEKMEASRNFANKLWNATRFVVRSLEGGAVEKAEGKLETEDRWILSRLNRTVANVTGLMDDFQFGEAERQIHDFLWGEYCDWYIELAKIRLQAEDITPLPVLAQVLEISLRLLHPYMPFITEELWQQLKKNLKGMQGESIMVARYPESRTEMVDPNAEKEMKAIVEIVREIRDTRAEYKVEAGRRIHVIIYAEARLRSVISRLISAIEALAHATSNLSNDAAPAGRQPNTLTLPLSSRAWLAIPMASMLDIAAEKKKVEKEIEQVSTEVNRLEARLKDNAFLSKAPAAVVEKERQKLYTLSGKLEKLKEQKEQISIL